MLWNHKLDKEALADCCNFMNQALSTTYSRNANMWGYLAYYMFLLEWLANSSQEAMDGVFEYLCKNAVQQNYMASQHSSLINKFILAVENCRTNFYSASAGPDRSIHHHNLRTTERPPGPFHASTNFMALKVDSICTVIQKLTGERFKKEEVKRAFEEAGPNSCSYGFGKFYNVTTGWPIKKIMISPEFGQVDVPLPEEELLDSTLTKQRCWYVKQSYYDKVVKEAQDITVANTADYKSIVIKSTNRGVGEYNFFDYLTGRRELAWFGFRALGNVFGSYNGIRNLTNLELIAGIEEFNIQSNFGTLSELYNPTSLLEYYAYDSLPDMETLPPGLKINPFVFRNGATDSEMPDDELSQDYYQHPFEAPDEYEQVDSPPRKKRRDSDELRSGDGAAQQDSTPGSILTPRSGVTNTPLGSQGSNEKHFTRRIPEDVQPDEPTTDLDDDDYQQVCHEQIHSPEASHHMSPLLQVTWGSDDEMMADEEDDKWDEWN